MLNFEPYKRTKRAIKTTRRSLHERCEWENRSNECNDVYCLLLILYFYEITDLFWASPLIARGKPQNMYLRKLGLSKKSKTFIR